MSNFTLITVYLVFIQTVETFLSVLKSRTKDHAFTVCHCEKLPKSVQESGGRTKKWFLLSQAQTGPKNASKGYRG